VTSRYLEPHLDPTVPPALDGERAADEQGALAHAAQAAAAVRRLGHREAPAVVAHPQRDAVAPPLERHLHRARGRMARDVRQSLLRDPVDRELRLVGERRQVGVEAPGDRDAADGGEARRELGQRADQPELLEHLRPQLARDPPHLLERAPHRDLGLLDLGAHLWGRVAGERIELQEHPRQDLAHLVVQPARDPQALALLRSERPAAALAPLVLEPLEHLVESTDELDDLDSAGLGQALAGPEQVDGAHAPHEPLERGEGRPQQHQVEHEHQRERGGEVGDLDERDRRVDRDRRQGEQQRGDRQQRGVDREDPPEQR
jgi:hypothetical protein